MAEYNKNIPKNSDKSSRIRIILKNENANDFNLYDVLRKKENINNEKLEQFNEIVLNASNQDIPEEKKYGICQEEMN
jgi:hypothetical protein